MTKYFKSADKLMESFAKEVENNEMSYEEVTEEANRIIKEMYSKLYSVEENKFRDGYNAEECYDVNKNIFDEFESRVKKFCADMFFDI